MKKSLVALAVLGAFSGVASAQSSVSIYGLMDAWVGSQRDGAPGTKSTTVLNSAGLSTSRLGFKGSEDIGGGLSVIFGLEAGLSVDNGQSNAGGALQFNRQSFVGFSGGFGEVVAGKVWTAYDDIEAGAHQLGGATNFAVEYSVMDTGNNYTGNPNNGFKYSSPEFGGFSGAVSYSLDESATTKSNVMAFHVKYNGGPIYAGFAYQDEGDTADIKYTRINGSYDFGVAKLLLTYGRVKEAAGKANEYSIGVDVPMGDALTLSAGYAMHKAKSGYSTFATNEKARGLGLGATYMVSKRTTLYAAMVTADKKDPSGAKTNELRRYGVGVRHTF
ncbi:MAG: porin [Hydrogenophaga sp.]|uniref:porin n=1 Tax=Hydrogenophaga sp. TaxID=1904254 RepID=UPI001D5C92FB|nr:porin [Hydrogenophaga sp.]MBX3609745.1 porin [Hydrogenophaga sp.]